MDYLSLGGEVISKLIEKGELTMEQMEDAQAEYTGYVATIEAEWPPEKILLTLLEDTRNAFAWCRTRIQKLERANDEARRAGKSYKDRLHFSQDITKVEEFRVRVVERGKKLSADYKAGNFEPYGPARRYFGPGDMSWIEKFGFASQIRLSQFGAESYTQPDTCFTKETMQP